VTLHSHVHNKKIADAAEFSVHRSVLRGSGSKFRISGFGSRDVGAGYHVSDVTFRGSGVGALVSGSGFEDPGFGLLEIRVSGCWGLSSDDVFEETSS